MFRKYILPLLALAGVGLGIYAAIHSAKTIPPAAPVSDAPQPPYQRFVAGAGLVEASTENIAIGTHIAGIVSKIYVGIGSCVKAGDPLFTIDDRAGRAAIVTLQAAVGVAEADLADARYELKLAETLAADKIATIEQRDRSRYAVQKAEAQFAQAQANLKSAETDLERLTVRAPVDGQILQVKVHLGEFAPTGVLGQPLILLGSVSPLHVRVNVDENDAWRVCRGAAAIGYLRGNKDINTPLKFVRFEPYVVPKKSLTGESTERVDTRVLQVIFSFDRGELPIFVGQQMDVFIDAATSTPIETTTNSPTANLSRSAPL
jgi:HlyD family secretion protein